MELKLQHQDSKELERFVKEYGEKNQKVYRDHLHYDEEFPPQLKEVAPIFSKESKSVDGRLVVHNYFDEVLQKHLIFLSLEKM